MNNKQHQVMEYFNDILESVINAQNFIRNKTEEEFSSDQMTISAVTRCLENISRTARNIQRLDRRRRYGNLPWREMVGMNRKINHNYQEIAPAVLWQTVEEEFDELEKEIRSILGDYIRDDIPKHSVRLNRIKLVSDVDVTLTPTSLMGQITPYLLAVSELQKIIDSVKGQPIKPVNIKSISQNSPVSVSLDGAADATEVVRDIVVPWRRVHGKDMAQLEKQEKAVLIEDAKASVVEKRIRTQKERVETKKIEAEIHPEKVNIEIERMRLENEKLRLEIEEKRIKMALEILEIGPELSQEQRILFVMQLLKPLGILTTSSVQLDDGTTSD